MVNIMRCGCTDCEDEECTDACKSEQQNILSIKRMKYFRGNQSLDDVIAESILKKDVS